MCVCGGRGGNTRTRTPYRKAYSRTRAAGEEDVWRKGPAPQERPPGPSPRGSLESGQLPSSPPRVWCEGLSAHTSPRPRQRQAWHSWWGPQSRERGARPHRAVCPSRLSGSQSHQARKAPWIVQRTPQLTSVSTTHQPSLFPQGCHTPISKQLGAGGGGGRRQPQQGDQVACPS